MDLADLHLAFVEGAKIAPGVNLNEIKKPPAH
jgi:hypothetical protein